MSLERARKIIKEVKANNSNGLNLYGQMLTDKDLIELFPEIKEIKGLTWLSLSSNNLSNVDFLKEIKGLTTLSLSYNNLTNVDFLKELKGLTSLDLSYNNLSNVDFLKEIKGLTSLDLRNNNLSNVDFLKELDKLEELNLYGNERLDLPDSLKKKIEEKFPFSLDKKEIEEIKSYYKQLDEQGTDNIYEAKVLVVGEPKAGKTTLTQKVKDNAKWNAEMKGIKNESTVGVEIDTLDFPNHRNKDRNIKAHFWDFGGQEIQYSLHQYFLTERSLYILLGDSRKEFLNFEYWFEVIAAFGKDCPVLVVLNEIDGNAIKTFNINEYREHYGKYLESIEERTLNFYKDEDGKFETLKQEIQNKVCNLKHLGTPLPKTWVAIREKLEQLKEQKTYIEIDEFLEICKECNLTNAEYIKQVKEYLHDLGIALNYKNDIHLKNKFFLNPNWLIEALYVVLKDKKIVEDKGRFDYDFIENIWLKENYKHSDCQIFIELMQKGKFEIAYRLGKSNEFIVPLLLPYKLEFNYKLEELNKIQTIITYKFKPKGIVPRLIVRLHQNIVSKNGEQIVWNKGVVISHHNSIAEITERGKEIYIKVIGENSIHNRELLTIIRNEIVSIHRDWFDNRLIIDELVPCICEVCKDIDEKTYYKLNELEERSRNNKVTIECRNKPYHDVNVFKLLSATYIVKEISKDGENTIIVNYGTMIINKDIHHSTVDNLIEITNNSEEIINKIKEAFETINEQQTQELNELNLKLFEQIQKQFVDTNKFNENQSKEFEEVKRKYSSETKIKVKQSVPFEWFIKQFTGFSVELEKEFKTSAEIKPELVLNRFRNLLYGKNVEENLLRLKG